MNKVVREGFIADEPAEVGVTSEVPETPPVDVVEETWPIRVKLLHRPLVFRDSKGDHALRELSFREPTGGDLNRNGNPCRVNSDGDVIIDERKMTALMAVLSGVNLPHILTMDPRDWNSCAYRLRNFFLPNPDAWL